MNRQHLTLGGLYFFEKLAVVASLSHILKWQQSAVAHQIFFSSPHSPLHFLCSQASSPHSLFDAWLHPDSICAGHTGLRCAFCCFIYIITYSNCLLCVCLLFASRCTFLEGRDCALYFFSVSLSRQRSAVYITNMCLINTFPGTEWRNDLFC